MKPLLGKSVIVTGAASGIGRVAAILFAERGANVALVDRSPEVEATAEAIRELDARVLAFVKDAASESDVEQFTQATAAEFGGLDVFYANAAISGGFPVFDELTAKDWMEVLSANLVSSFLAVKHASRIMMPARSGSIICTTSVAGMRAGGGAAPYSASKAGIVSLVQTSASQFAGTGVRVNAICPGLTDETGMGRPILDWARKTGVEREIVQVIPARRVARAREVAQAAAFLASDDSSYINGHVLVIDGGLSSSLPIVPPNMIRVPARQPS